MKVYIASPLGFTQPTKRFYDEILLPTLRDAGVEPLDPWANSDPIEEALRSARTDASQRLEQANSQVGAANEEMLRSSRAVFAVLDGADVDSGTAAEIGWAAAKGLPIVGWRSDLRESGEAGGVVNLQVAYFIERSGGSIEADLDTAIETLVRLLGS